MKPTIAFVSLLILLTLIILIKRIANGQRDHREGVMEGVVHYYGIDQSLKTVDYGQMSVDQAVKIVDERLAQLKPKYETGEETLADTMFGFNRSRDTFIEICIHTPTQISFKFEFPTSKKFLIFQHVYQKETEVTSKEELLERIRSFFHLTPEAYKQYLERQRH